MNSRDLIPILGILMLAATTAMSIVGAYLMGRGRRTQVEKPKEDFALAARVERMEHMVDSMTVELERMGEGQRFLIKVLGDSHLVPRNDRPQRVVTPH